MRLLASFLCVLLLSQGLLAQNNCNSASGLDVAGLITGAVAGAVGNVPVVGGILSSLISFLVPVVENANGSHRDLSDCAWQQILNAIQAMIGRAIDANNLAMLNQRFTSQQANLNQFAQLVDAVGWYNASISAEGGFFDFVYKPALDNDAYFQAAQTPSAPGTVLPVITQAATLTIGAFEEMYCNGSRYISADPTDKLRACHLQNLQNEVLNYIGLVQNTILAYNNWDTAPSRIAIDDGDYAGKTWRYDCGCAAGCYCGYVKLNDAWNNNAPISSQICTGSLNSNIQNNGQPNGLCWLWWRDDLFGNAVDGTPNHATLYNFLPSAEVLIANDAFQAGALNDMKTFSNYLDALNKLNAQITSDPTQLCHEDSVVRTQLQPFPGTCDTSSNEYHAFKAMIVGA